MDRDERGRIIEILAIRLGVTILCFAAIAVLTAVQGLAFYGVSPQWRDFQAAVRVIALLIALAIWFVPMDWIHRRR